MCADSRIREIQELFLRPPPPQSPPPQEPQAHPAREEEVAPVSGVPSTVGTSEGIRFIMTDELAETEDGPVESQHISDSWVDVAEEKPSVEIEETIVEGEVNGHTVVQDTITVTMEVRVFLNVLTIFN